MEEIRDILVKLDTQIDGVEAYLKQLIEIGEQTCEDGSNEDLLRACRVYPDVCQDVHVKFLRAELQRVKDIMDRMNP